MWTPEHRAAARRQDLRYASDLTDEEWALVAPMIPPARRGGRPRDVNMREVINGLLYLLWTGCQWHHSPRDDPPHAAPVDQINPLSMNPNFLDRLLHIFPTFSRTASRVAVQTNGALRALQALTNVSILATRSLGRYCGNCRTMPSKVYGRTGPEQ
jgi:transposase